MASYQWIKLYDEILDDPKMGRLSDGAYRACINIFLLASRQEGRDGSLPDFDDMAWILRISVDQLNEYWQELERAGIAEMRDGQPFVCNFGKRQTATNDAERMRQYRARKKKQAQKEQPTEEEKRQKKAREEELRELVTDTVTPSDTNAITEPLRNVTQIKNRDKEGDKEKKRGRGRKHHPPHFPLEPICQLITALAEHSSQTLWSETQEKFDEAAELLFGWDATPEQVQAFANWWDTSGWHNNKPAVKNFIDHWRDFKQGKNLRRKNGRSPATSAPPSQGMKRTPETTHFEHGGAY